MVKLVDLSQLIETGMPVYPGDTETSLVQTKHLAADVHNNHRLEISMHTGTHIDSPMHLLAREEYIAELSLDSFMGVGCLLDVRGQSLIRWRGQYAQSVPANSIVLLYSGHDKLYGTEEYYAEYPTIDLDFCDQLLGKKIKMLGLDWPSPDSYPFPAHKRLLEKDVFVLENLTNLGQLLGVAEFEVMAFPLKLKADSSMTRAVARII